MKRFYTTLSLLTLLALSFTAGAQRITVTIAGNGVSGHDGDGKPGRQARISGPQYITSDLSGNVFFVDGSTIRKVDAKGIVTTFAGGGTATGEGIPATSASMTPMSICTNYSGDVFVVTGAKVKKIDASSNTLSTYAGTGSSGYSGDGGAASAATFNGINGICTDMWGNLFIVDKNNHRIRKVTASTSIITTFAGNGTSGYTGDGGAATSAAISYPTYICAHPVGDIYFTDQFTRYIRKVSASTGIITTYAGGGSTLVHCLASNTNLGPVSGIIFDGAYNLCWDETSCSCRKIDHTTDSVEYIGGNFTTESYKDDTNSLYAWMNNNSGLTTDTSDNIYVADRVNNRIRKLMKLTNQPTFAFGSSQSINPCPGYSFPLDMQLAITDLDSGQTETWTVVSGPSVGSLAGFPATAVSVGVRKTSKPTGAAYVAPTSYTGADSFIISVSDGALTSLVTVYVNVQGASAASISGPTNVCGGSTITLSASSGAGTWSATNSRATVDSVTGIVRGATSGWDTIVYNLVAPCPITSTYAVLVNPLPTIGSITGPDTICAGTTVTYTNSASGGTWASSYTAYASIDPSTGVATGLRFSNSTINITYRVASSAGCAVTATKSVYINAPVSTIQGVGNLCVGSNANYYNYRAGGSWRLSNGNAVIMSSSSSGTYSIVNILGISGGRDTLYYVNTNACGTDSIFVPINVIAPSSVTISGSSDVCVYSTTTLSTSVSGGTWHAANTNATISPAGIVTGYAAGTDSMTYTVSSSSSGCAATAGVMVHIYRTGDAGTLSGPSSVCTSSMITLSSTLAGGTWTGSNATAIVSASSGNITGISPGMDTVTYSVTNVCGTSSATYMVTINTSPNAGIITGPSNVCTGAAITLADAVSGGTWSTANANAVISSTGVVTGAALGVDTIFYSVTNMCGTATASSIINIATTPDPGVITGPTTICTGITTSLGEAVTGGTWSVTNSNASVSSTGMITALAPGIDTVLYTVIKTCGSSQAMHNITITDCHNAGVVETGANQAINIFPNPATSILNIEWPAGATDVHITLTDAAGRTAISESIADNNIHSRKLDLTLLPDGIYLVKVQAGRSYATAKVVLRR